MTIYPDVDSQYAYWKSQQITPPEVDDHVCGCGNTKCSKSERSCWKCGAPIHDPTGFKSC